ncbi:MAG: 50S ribosomal protein L9 [Candidatus Hydrogenedentes bacterium]|nr:50S ribosomal protein L9 [Candidatus Hydrogenedentota bacterium]
MKVILCEDVDNLGPMGDIVNVARGYARNYLLPRRLAVVADSASAKQIEHEMRIIKKRENQQREVYQGRIKGFEGISVEMTAKAGTEGKLYGSITSLHIAAKLIEMGHDIDRRKLVLDEPIRSLGEHTVRLRLMKDVEADIRIVVTADTAVEEVVVDDFVDLEEGGTAAEAEAKADKAREKRERSAKASEAKVSAADATEGAATDADATEEAQADADSTEEAAPVAESTGEAATAEEPAPGEE